ncbi:MAG: phenylalanine--tRNA ligase subunit alpha [Thermofilaceae archaeon]
MDGAPILVLSERQKKILDSCASGSRELDELASELRCRREDLMRDIEELKAKGLIEIDKSLTEKVELTKEGHQYVNIGLPEERVVGLIRELGELDLSSLPRLPGFSEDDVRIGVMHLAKAGALKVDGTRVKIVNEEALTSALMQASELRRALEAIAAGESPKKELIEILKRRRMVSAKRVFELRVVLTDDAKNLLRKGMITGTRLVTALTPQLIISGEWRSVQFKSYDLSLRPPSLYPGRKHPYLEFLDYIRELLVAMGFEEVKGPHVELELWNFDALFQAQDHPAREIHDTFFVKYPAMGRVSDQGLLRRIGEVHEFGGDVGSKGWRYKWDPIKALHLVLRTQTTAVSARTLYRRGDGEYRCFALDRVFRPENLDAKHSMEFYQLEGIIVSRHVTLRHLVGFFHELARELGLGPVKIKPGYFPFTEPSVEGFVKHEKLGWMEVFPGGMFRPEVLRSLGIKESNVAAWGIGIDRIAMIALNVDDIRTLFTQDLDFLRKWCPPIRW